MRQLAEALPRGLRTLLASKISLHGDTALTMLTNIGAGVRVLDLSHNLCMTPTDAVVSLPAIGGGHSLSQKWGFQRGN